jgi:hypothetical protein
MCVAAVPSPDGRPQLVFASAASGLGGTGQSLVVGTCSGAFADSVAGSVAGTVSVIALPLVSTAVPVEPVSPAGAEASAIVGMAGHERVMRIPLGIY